MDAPSSRTIVVRLCLCGRPRVFYQRVLRASIFVLLAGSLAAARDMALVSNKSNSVNAITLTDLVKVYADAE